MYSTLRTFKYTKRGYRGNHSHEKEFKSRSQQFRNNSYFSRFSSKKLNSWGIAALGIAISIPMGLLLRKYWGGTTIVLASTRTGPYFELKPLPYGKKDLEPWISEDTVNTHYEKHHRGYLNKLNVLLEHEGDVGSLEGIILREKKGDLFNMAAQVYNHTFYWESMSPKGGGKPTGEIAEMINQSFGSFEEFKKQFHDSSVSHFGSGWTWLTYNPSHNILQIVTTHDANTPLNKGLHPILVCDIWEHAYYLDYKNERGSYVNRWWNVVNWDYANKNLANAKSYRV